MTHAVNADVERCNVPWPVCPDCPGQRLTVSAGVARCSGCGQRWQEHEVTPCALAATVALRDAERTWRVCESHAAHPSARLLVRRPYGRPAVTLDVRGEPGQVAEAFALAIGDWRLAMTRQEIALAIDRHLAAGGRVERLPPGSLRLGVTPRAARQLRALGLSLDRQEAPTSTTTGRPLADGPVNGRLLGSLRLLAVHPKTTEELAPLLGVPVRAARKVTRKLKDRGLVFGRLRLHIAPAGERLLRAHR